jgi:hypothetical protein
VEAIFVHLPAFERHRAVYLDDDGLRGLENQLLRDPEAGDSIPDSGGLRKLRFADTRRGKGTRGGLRVIYYWWAKASQFWLFTIYSKNEMADLAPKQRKMLKAMIKAELAARQRQ